MGGRGSDGSGSDCPASYPELNAEMKASIPSRVVRSYPADWLIEKIDFAIPKFEGSFIMPGKSGTT